MVDVHDAATRQRNMSAIKGKNTTPEILIRKLCHSMGFRFRLHSKHLPGKPDIVFPKYKAVILVNGCFWHGHDCYLFKIPGTRRDFWENKIADTQIRDENQIDELLNLGWRVMVVWECCMKGRHRKPLEEVGDTISGWLNSGTQLTEIRGAV